MDEDNADRDEGSGLTQSASGSKGCNGSQESREEESADGPLRAAVSSSSLPLVPVWYTIVMWRCEELLKGQHRGISIS